MKEWDFHTVAGVLEEGEQVIVVRDLTPGPGKYRHQRVRGIVSKTKVRGADRLWLRAPKGQLLTSEPWYLKIVEELPTE